MQMNNMAELITVHKYWKQWPDHRRIVCVFNNEDFNQVTWEPTTLLVATVEAGGGKGVGYTYADAAGVSLIEGLLRKATEGRDSFDISGAWLAMQKSVRNLGRSGLASCAISAIDTALWDLKAQALDLPLASLLGRCREHVPIYGSGGFTTYTDAQLKTQLSDWVERDGCRFVKMKIGTEPERDPERIMQAKDANGDHELCVDANGAFSVRQTLNFADACPDADIRWFEEPVTSDDLPGLHLMRERAPDSMEIAAARQHALFSVLTDEQTGNVCSFETFRGRAVKSR